ncbi:acetolactate decarboxylase [Pseudoruegeria sp. SK021]|uniref:acetolactate decarboxylase n=1 Tax=Pseudoruegeria sp. SK021 TaxID=1933035 RepID=UPI000A261903|nr:acetolactate decarboxylase [Pseudoruegeria sp. SK021]OSP53813.1 acetolactate decarboxylase [Pseudoruegeria sp. SK021]
MTRIEVDLPNSLLLELDRQAAASAQGRSQMIASILAEHMGERLHTIFQVSTSGALVAGVFDREVSVSTLLEHGDFGLGTFAGLDGEMVVLDGVAYQVHGTGAVKVAAKDAGAPFAAVTRFSADETGCSGTIMDMKTLTEACDRFRKSENIFYAIRLDGCFDRISTRAVKPPVEGVGLAEASKSEGLFSFEDITGTLVGIWSPAFSSAFSVPGYHFHFISEDHQHGGHLLDIAASDLKVQVNALTDFHLVLPETEKYLKADLSQNNADDLAYAEEAHKD